MWPSPDYAEVQMRVPESPLYPDGLLVEFESRSLIREQDQVGALMESFTAVAKSDGLRTHSGESLYLSPGKWTVYLPDFNLETDITVSSTTVNLNSSEWRYRDVAERTECTC